MTDPLAGQDPEETAPAAPPPANPEPDIEARLKQYEERLTGFQRMVAEKDKALAAARQEAADLRMSGMSEDEKAEAEWQSLQDKVQQLEQENALLSLATEYPEEMPVFRNLLTASTPKEQLEAIRALRASVAAASTSSSTQPNPTEGEAEIPEVDPNNPPARAASAGPIWNGQVQSEDWADRILGSVRRMRG